MEHNPSDSVELPIVCTLGSAELEARRGQLSELLAQSNLRETIPKGGRWRFNPKDGLLAEIAAAIDAERHCCRFLRFRVVVEPAQGPFWLEVTGPPGAWEFLADMLDPRS